LAGDITLLIVDSVEEESPARNSHLENRPPSLLGNIGLADFKGSSLSQLAQNFQIQNRHPTSIPRELGQSGLFNVNQ